MTVRTAGSATGRTLGHGGRLGAELCRRDPVELVTVTVRRRSGAGPFALRVSWPGSAQKIRDQPAALAAAAPDLTTSRTVIVKPTLCGRRSWYLR